MKKKEIERRPEENPLYHDTWTLLKNYRDAVWSLELSVNQAKARFQIEFGSSIEDFLESVYIAGADLSGTDIEHQAKCIERSHKMIQLVNSAAEIVRNKHKHGEILYWILYYTFLSPQELEGGDDILEKLRPHMHDVSYRTYYRKRREAIEALGAVLWGYTSPDSLPVLERHMPK